MIASEARMRDYAVEVPGDCVAPLFAVRNTGELGELEEVHQVKWSWARVRLAKT